jgi:hypothetical protein
VERCGLRGNWWPFFLASPGGYDEIMPRMFVYQTIFLAVLFAVTVNLRKPRGAQREQTKTPPKFSMN